MLKLELEALFGEALGASATCDAEAENGQNPSFAFLLVKAEAYATAYASDEDDEEAFVAKFNEGYGRVFARAYEIKYAVKHL